MIDETTMYVVYLTPEAVEEHNKILESVNSYFLDKTPALSRLAPSLNMATSITAYRNLVGVVQQPLESMKPLPDWQNHHIENVYGLEMLSKVHAQTPPNWIPAVLIFANGNVPGATRMGAGQEESFLRKTSLGYGMRNVYPKNDIWKGMGGIYAVLCKTESKRAFWAIVMSAPNISEKSINYSIDNKLISTQNDRKLFNFDPQKIPENVDYMRHLLGEVLMQFYMVKSLNSPIFMTGAFGSDRFAGDPEYYAAAVRFVSQLPQFKDIKVCYALDANKDTEYSKRPLNTVFNVPKESLLNLCRRLFDNHFGELSAKQTIDGLLAVSNMVQKFYCIDLPLMRPVENIVPVSKFWEEKGKVTQPPTVPTQQTNDSSGCSLV